MNTEVISMDAAEQEWREFLINNNAGTLIPDEEMKRSSDKDSRDDYNNKKAGFDRVAKAISRGNVVIENNIVTQKLQYPITAKDESTVILDKLSFNNRWTVKDRSEIFKNIDPNDLSQFFAAQTRFCSKITGVELILLGKVDMSDAKITDQIVSVFFM